MNPNKVDKDILAKLMRYCAYQERCLKEVSDKLASFQIRGEATAVYIDKLIEEDFLNQERFAYIFAGSKFRVKHWGRLKIKQKLKEKRLPPHLITKALRDAIDEEQYLRTVHSLCLKKWKELTNKNDTKFDAKPKIIRYLQQKGYEMNYIIAAIKTVLV